jgi:hypothetical protein
MNLLEMLPEDYQHSAEVADLEKALAVETDQALDAKDDLLRQLNVDTATWGLALWEKAYGIDLDVSKSLADRRSRIKSKMRARGVTTVDVIRKVAESFAGDQADVRVIEHNPEYRFVIQYIETLGQPPDYRGLAEAVEEIKPAHLAWGVEFDERAPGKVGISAISKFGVILTLYPWQVHHYESVSTVRTAAAVKSCLTVTVLERS